MKNLDRREFATITPALTAKAGSGQRAFLSRSRQRGVAIITAIFYTVLASILAVSLVSTLQLEIRRTGNVIDNDRAYVFGLGVEAWVTQLLLRDDAKKDSLDEDWAIVLPPIVVEGGQIAGRIEDMQGRFNLNNLVIEGKRSEPDVQRFNRLLQVLGITAEITPAIVDWLDEDAEPSFPDGAEDDAYYSQPVPYRAANRLMASPSELRLIKGVTPEIFDLIEPYVTALPQRTALNVNTASAPLLATITDGMTLADGETLIELRDEESFPNVDQFLQQPVFQDKEGIQSEALSVTTEYFLVDAQTQYGERGKLRLFSLLQRKGGKVATVMRAEGVL